MYLCLPRHHTWVFALTFLIAACHVQFVPAYSAELEKQVADAAKATDKLYLQVIDAESNDQRTFALFKDSYLMIETEINSILLKNQAREKNQDFLAIIDNLKKAFVEAKEYHKSHGTLSSGEAKGYQASLAGFWAPLYVAEMALKDPKSK